MRPTLSRVLVLILLGTSGCAGLTPTQQRTLSGGAMGAGTGAVIGLIAGPPGALVGAVVGGAAGSATGANWDQIQNATGGSHSTAK